VADVGDHLDARVGELLAGAVPEAGGVTVGEEEGLAELVADFRHARLDVGGDLRRGVQRKEQVILQVPADALAILCGERERERHRGREPSAGAFEGDLDLVVPGHGLGALGEPERSPSPVAPRHDPGGYRGRHGGASGA
jgi:hypothetical protein